MAAECGDDVAVTAEASADHYECGHKEMEEICYVESANSYFLVLSTINSFIPSKFLYRIQPSMPKSPTSYCKSQHRRQ